jgi:hypothetical protein
MGEMDRMILRQRLRIRSISEKGSPSSDVSITKYAKTKNKARDAFDECSNFRNITKAPEYIKIRNGRWSVTWSECKGDEDVCGFSPWKREIRRGGNRGSNSL